MYLSLFIPISIISVPSNPGLGFSLCYPTLASFLHASFRCHHSSNAFFVGAGPIVLLFVVFTRLSSIVSFPPRLCTFAPPPHVALSRFIVFNLQKHLPAPQQYFPLLVLSTRGTTFIHTLHLAFILLARISTLLAVTINFLTPVVKEK